MNLPSINYLESYWFCASGLSVVNAIGNVLDPTNSGLARWHMTVLKETLAESAKESGVPQVCTHIHPGCGERAG